MAMRFLDRVKRTALALRENRKGAAATEFALVAAPLMATLLGCFDLGYQAYLRSVVQGALNDVARTASLEAPELNCTGTTVVAQVECAIKRRSDIVARKATYEVRIRNYFDFVGVGRSEKLVTDYNNNGRYDPGDCFIDLNENGAFDANAGREGVGSGDDVVFYEVTVRMPRLFPIHQFINTSPNYAIRGETAIRNQPYTRQRVPPTVCV
ncbi:MAG: TadE/TadG family type IV pilus assembly protein [Novosphingobium meiothermophilum]|uniref:TadE/TadG family type IV pilus assembly protein n=1 Tax=Novosphingobium TaxID=165696 RepID=UPI001F2D4846|nr:MULTISPECIES: TadE family protein [Novosphingobium]